MIKNFEHKRLVFALKKGDKNALKKIFDYYYPRLYNFSKSFLKIEADIDDILQDVFIKIWENRKNISSTDTFNSLIFTITKNKILNLIRTKYNNQTLKEKIYRLSVGKEFLLSENIEFNDLKVKIDEIENKLPEKHKEIYLLSRKKGLSHREIADKLQVSTKTVEYHITCSLRIIKKALNDLGVLSILFWNLFM